MAGDEDDQLCPCCDLIVDDSDNALECEGFCKKWHHAACVDISKDNYDSISSLGTKVKWFCDPCTLKIDKMIIKACDIDDFLGLNNMVKKLINTTKLVSKDNIEINEKLSILTSENVRLCNEVAVLKSEVSRPSEFLKLSDQTKLSSNVEQISLPNQASVSNVVNRNVVSPVNRHEHKDHIRG